MVSLLCWGVTFKLKPFRQFFHVVLFLSTNVFYKKKFLNFDLWQAMTEFGKSFQFIIHLLANRLNEQN